MTADAETVEVETEKTVCDGGSAAGHPRVFLSLAKTGKAVCPYCGKIFSLKPGAVSAH